MLTLFLALIAAVSAHAAKPPVTDTLVPATTKFVSVIDSQVAFYIDSTDTLGIKALLKPKVKDRFELNPNTAPLNLGYNSHPVWIAFQLENNDQRPQEMAFETRNSRFDSVEAYIVYKDTVFDHYRSGSKIPLKYWPIKFRNPTFTTFVPPHGYREIYLRIHSLQPIRVPVTIYSRDSFATYKDITNLIFSLFYAILCIIVLHNLFLFFAHRDYAYLFYLACNVVLIWILANLNGFPFQYGELTALRLDDLTLPYLLLAYYFLLFSIGYLRVRKMPKVFLYVFTAAGIIYPLAGYTLYRMAYPFQKVQQPMIIALLAITFIGALYQLQKRYRPAWHFLSGIWVTILGTLLYMLSTKGTINNQPWLAYSLQVGLIIGAALLSIGLSERQKLLDKEKGTSHLDFLSGIREYLHALHNPENGNTDTDSK